MFNIPERGISVSFSLNEILIIIESLKMFLSVDNDDYNLRVDERTHEAMSRWALSTLDLLCDRLDEGGIGINLGAE